MLKWYMFDLPPGYTRHHYYFQQCLPYIDPNLIMEFALNSVMDYLRLYQPRRLDLNHFHLHRETHHLSAQVKYEADVLAYEVGTGELDIDYSPDFQTEIYRTVFPLYDLMRDLLIMPIFSLQNDYIMMEPVDSVDSYIGWLSDTTFVFMLASVPLNQKINVPSNMELMHMGVWV